MSYIQEIQIHEIKFIAINTFALILIKNKNANFNTDNLLLIQINSNSHYSRLKNIIYQYD